jgi:hypothetical protein
MKETTVTQPNHEIWYPWQRALRTFVQALAVLIPALNIAASNAVEVLREQGIDVPSSVFVWLNAIIVGTGLIMALVSRWMATPSLNKLLTQIGLGSAPKAAGTDVAPTTEDPDPNLDSGVPPSDQSTSGD